MQDPVSARDVPDIRPCFDGDQWTPEAVGAWLAGLFDRAGRIQFGKRRPVVLSVADTQPQTLALIQQHLKAGELMTRVGKRGRAVSVWRIEKPRDVWRVLTTMLLYLTTNRETAYQALDRIREAEAKREADRRLDLTIVAEWIKGETESRIAAAFQVTAARVATALARHRRGPLQKDV